MAIVVPSLPFSSSDSSGDIDRNATSSSSPPPPLPLPLPAVELTLAPAVAALLDGHDEVLVPAVARLFLTDERRFGPDPGGRKRNESLTQPAYAPWAVVRPYGGRS